jgi:OCT family organic cation transporter-like MFS transporter 4/5
MIMMAAGIYVSIIAGNITIFSIGVFFFNAGYRGFYNASLLSLTEVMGERSRATTPMVLSIGWAFGQIFIAFLGAFVTYWRAIFIITAIPLTVLIYYAYIHTKESPRFLVVKHEFSKAVRIVEEIAMVNETRFSKYELVEEVSNNEKMNAYRNAMGAGELISRLKHHSYMSLFNYNSIRIRVLIVGGIWSIFSLSYFISANSQINPDRSIIFNIALAGVVEIIAYMVSILTSLNLGRVFVIKRLLLLAGIIHVCYYFIGPLNEYHGFSKVIVMTFDIGVRVTVSIGNTFLAIYALELFPTSIRHFALGMLGFITKLMFWLSSYFNIFWS